MNKRTAFILFVALMVLQLAVYAQPDDGKIIVEITKDVNGEKETFKGEYENADQMRSDPSYKEFAGEDEGFNFWIDTDGDEDAFLQIDQFKDKNKSFYHFFHGSGDDEDAFFFKQLDGDSSGGFFSFNFDGFDSEALKERMEKLGVEMNMIFRNRDNEGTRSSASAMNSKRVKVLDVENEFGKRGRVDTGNMLALNDLAFSPNPSSNGRFKVRFKLPEEGELNICVSNLDGKAVFTRYFERFGGTYSEMIDLSGQKEGIYLLEISQGKKRLTKKIVIN